MSLILCQRCQEHHLLHQDCPNCQKRSPSYMLPLAVLLGIGCKKNQAEPEVMALYGGPPIEEPVEIPLSTEPAEEADKTDDSTETKSPEASTKTDDAAEKNQENTEEIRPEREIMALYGAPPMEPIRVESLEKSTEETTETTEDPTSTDD